MKTLLTATIACLMGISVAAQVHSTLYLQGSYSKPQNADGVLKQYFTGDYIWQDETARQLAATEISGVTSGVVGMEWYSGHITYGFRNQLGIYSLNHDQKTSQNDVTEDISLKFQTQSLDHLGTVGFDILKSSTSDYQDRKLFIIPRILMGVAHRRTHIEQQTSGDNVYTNFRYTHYVSTITAGAELELGFMIGDAIRLKFLAGYRQEDYGFAPLGINNLNYDGINDLLFNGFPFRSTNYKPRPNFSGPYISAGLQFDIGS